MQSLPKSCMASCKYRQPYSKIYVEKEIRVNCIFIPIRFKVSYITLEQALFFHFLLKDLCYDKIQ